jgi:hypothetical protein
MKALVCARVVPASSATSRIARHGAPLPTWSWRRQRIGRRRSPGTGIRRGRGCVRVPEHSPERIAGTHRCQHDGAVGESVAFDLAG